MNRSLISSVLAIVIMGCVVFVVAHERFDLQAEKTSRERLGLYASSVENALIRWSHLPLAIALNPNALKTIDGYHSGISFSQTLKQINENAGSDALYLMNATGRTIATSNFDQQETFLGKNYAFRPYFQTAMHGKKGSLFAVGATTGRPGYFMSVPVLENDDVRGVAVVKTEFSALLAGWKNIEETVFVTDRFGVIILTNKPELAFSAIRKLEEPEISLIARTRRYGDYVPTLLDGALNKEGKVYTIGATHNIAVTQAISSLEWKIHLLVPASKARNAALVYGLLAILLSGLVLAVIWVTKTRIRQRELEITARDAEAMRVINNKLEAEIAQRAQTDRRLRETQSELIQSSRLAALGKMSAAIVHEVNQPVSAIRNYAASGALLAGTGREAQSVTLFDSIRQMTDRLGAITSDLLVFSRKPASDRVAVSINQVIEAAIELNRVELNVANVDLVFHEDQLGGTVMASTVRLEQLFSNLIRNAIQACNVSTSKKPEINISVGQRQVDGKPTIRIQIADSGHGIEPELVDQLFDPFFTTKPVGEGVGLGLALSFAIVDEAGGRIYAANRTDATGAEFTVELPIYASQTLVETEGTGPVASSGDLS